MPMHGGQVLTGAVSLAPQTINTDTATTGGAVDITGYERVAIMCTAGTITLGNFTWSLTECATVGGTYTAVAAADIIPHSTGTGANGAVHAVTDDDTTHVFFYRGSKPFIKVVCTSASSANGALIGAWVLGMEARHEPA